MEPARDHADNTVHRHLPLLDLRREILTCNRCFTGTSRCWHHEDIVGGYGPGRITVVGLNPQAAQGNRVYEAIRDASWQTKLALSDSILDVFGRGVVFEDIHPDWGWMNGRHPGIATWFPRVCTHLGVTPEILADHFTFVETFKHATRDQGSLVKHRDWARIRSECPRWLKEQLTRLQPRLVVLCGSAGKDIVAPLLVDSSRADALRRTRVLDLHGRTETIEIASRPVPVVFTIAISGQTAGRWRKSTGTAAVRNAVQTALRGQ